MKELDPVALFRLSVLGTPGSEGGDGASRSLPLSIGR
jgi:hypothetical protein